MERGGSKQKHRCMADPEEGVGEEEVDRGGGVEVGGRYRQGLPKWRHLPRPT